MNTDSQYGRIHMCMPELLFEDVGTCPRSKGVRPWSKSVTTRFSPREGFEDLVFTSKTNNPINAANIKDSINYIVDRINRENPEQLDQNATAPTAR